VGSPGSGMTMIVVDEVKPAGSDRAFPTHTPSYTVRIIFFRIMDPTDLFSFLEQAPDALEKGLDEVDMVDVPTRKRKASPSAEQPVQNGEPSHSGENGVDSPSHKRLRFASPVPIVIDEVEVEAKREVKVSAGLMSAETDETGPRLELRHQARHLVSIPCLCTDWNAYRLDTKLLYLQFIHTFQSPNTSRRQNRHESTSSPSTHSNNFQ